MPLDSRIPLMGNQLEVQQVQNNRLAQLAQQDMAKQKLAMDKESQGQQMQMSQEQLEQQKFNNLESRAQSRIKSTVIAAAELNSYLEGGDVEGARAFLQARKKNLMKRAASGEDIDTQETDHALQALEKDPETLKKQVGNALKFGQSIGLIDKGAKKGGATMDAAYALMEENPGMSFSDAFSISKSGAGQGNTYKDGKIQPIGGKDDAVQSAASAKAKGTEIGKAEGEAANAYEDFKAATPGLNEFGNRLYQLADLSTFTKTGELRDSFMRQFNFDPTDAARAKAEAETMIDTEILPLLRPTFGAAFTVKEGEWLRATMGDQSKSPGEKKAQIQARMASWQRQAERLAKRTGNPEPAPDTFKINEKPDTSALSDEDLLKQLGISQ